MRSGSLVEPSPKRGRSDSSLNSSPRVDSFSFDGMPLDPLAACPPDHAALQQFQALACDAGYLPHMDTAVGMRVGMLGIDEEAEQGDS